MKRIQVVFQVFIFCFCVVSQCFAERSEAEALAIAREQCTRLGATSGAGAPRMRGKEARIAERNSSYYAVNTGEGFVLVAKDEQLPAVLGYSDHGVYQQDSLPAGLRYWLRNYERAKVSSGNARHASGDVCAPLVSCQWDQDAPYNNMCPQYSSDGRCVTGCAATAVAQIMYAHRHPSSGTGSESYRWRCEEDNSYSQTLSVNYGSATYDWAHMLGHYRGFYTMTQANAVAQLMYHLGVGMHMDYSSSGSGAIDYYMLNVLYEHMGYSRDIRTIRKDYWALPALQQELHDELAAGRPILTTGYDETGGHAFVCDGYDSDGLFHFNWGWGGYGDGYYLVTELNPTVQGIGANSLGTYNDGTTFYTGIRPETGTSEGRPQLYADSITASPNSSSRNGEFTATLHFVYNGSVFGIYNQYSIGVALLSADGESIVSILDQFTDNDHFYVGSYYNEPLTFSFRIPSSVGIGNYRLCGVFKGSSGDWQKIECLGGDWYKDVDVSGIRVTINDADHSKDYPSTTLQASGMRFSRSAISRTDTFSVFISGLSNAGYEDFTGNVGIEIYKRSTPSDIYLLGQTSQIHSISAGKSMSSELRVQCEAIPSRMLAGDDYVIRAVSQVLYQDLTPIETMLKTPLQKGVTVATKSTWLQDIELPQQVRFGQDTIDATGTIPPLQFTIPTSVHNFTCDVALHIETLNGEIVDEQIVGDVIISGVYDYTFPMTIPVKERLPRNQSYRAVLRWRLNSSDSWHDFGPADHGKCTFVLYDSNEPMGTEEVTTSELDLSEAHTIYTTTGQRISSLLEHGCFIIEQGGHIYKVVR